MANKNREEFLRVFKKLETVSKKVLQPDQMKDLGKAAAEIIRVRTRLGFGVKQDGDKKERLKPLSDSYVDQRTRDREKGLLSKHTTPKKSNLTRTAQMLYSIDVVSVNAKSVKVAPTGDRSDTDLSNAEVAGYVTENGRAFMNLSALELKQIQRLVREAFKKLLTNT